jgi:hypothetical protein
MRVAKQNEMEAIYRSYEWLIRERLEQLDVLSRSLYREMGVFGIPADESRAFVKKKSWSLYRMSLRKEILSMPKVQKLDEVRASIIDLTRVYKPKMSEVPRFVRDFIRKYNVTRGYNIELEKTVHEELEKMQDSTIKN